jgi:hypothetical protein
VDQKSVSSSATDRRALTPYDYLRVVVQRLPIPFDHGASRSWQGGVKLTGNALVVDVKLIGSWPESPGTLSPRTTPRLVSMSKYPHTSPFSSCSGRRREFPPSLGNAIRKIGSPQFKLAQS